MGVRLDEPRQKKPAPSFDDKSVRRLQDLAVVCDRFNRSRPGKYASGERRTAAAVENPYMTKKN